MLKSQEIFSYCLEFDRRTLKFIKRRVEFFFPSTSSISLHLVENVFVTGITITTELSLYLVMLVHDVDLFAFLQKFCMIPSLFNLSDNFNYTVDDVLVLTNEKRNNKLLEACRVAYKFIGAYAPN